MIPILTRFLSRNQRCDGSYQFVTTPKGCHVASNHFYGVPFHLVHIIKEPPHPSLHQLNPQIQLSFWFLLPPFGFVLFVLVIDKGPQKKILRIYALEISTVSTFFGDSF